MKNLIFLLLLALQLQAISLKNLNSVEAIYGTDHGTIHEQKINSAPGYFISLTTYNDIVFSKHFTITSTINYTNYTAHYSRAFNKEFSDDEYFELSELMVNAYITSNNVLSTGIFSFKNGAFSEHSQIEFEKSDALMTLYHMNMTGVFYTHYFNNNNKIQIGYARRIDKIYKLPEDRYDYSRNGSYMTYLFTSHHIGKHTIKLNISTSNLIAQKVGSSSLVNIGSMSIAGLGYQYDDRDDSGILYYTIAGLNRTNIDSTGLSPTGKSYTNGHKFNFGKEDVKYGYSLLLGVKKDYDANFFGMDTYTGLEYFYASKNWTSFAANSATMGQYGWGQLGHTVKVYTGVNITPKIKLGLTAQAQKILYSKIPGGNNSYPIDDTQIQSCVRLDILF